MRTAYSLSIAALLGAVIPLAFAPFAIWSLALISPALLFLLIDREMPMRRLFLHGWLFGNVYFGFGIYWAYNSLHDIGQAPPLVAGFVAALLIVYLAVFPPLACLHGSGANGNSNSAQSGYYRYFSFHSIGLEAGFSQVCPG